MTTLNAPPGADKKLVARAQQQGVVLPFKRPDAKWKLSPKKPVFPTAPTPERVKKAPYGMVRETVIPGAGAFPQITKVYSPKRLLSTHFR
jgi:hypothetical protein